MSCIECKYSIFCDTWGEYKCLKNGIRVRNPLYINCPDYEAGVPIKKECNCDDCTKERSCCDD